MVERWTIQVLGGLSARQGLRSVTRFRTRKTGALLAYLALQDGRPVARDVLLELLWPESELDAARNSLNVALSSLRAQLEAPVSEPVASPLGTVLLADRDTVRLHPDAFETDAATFEAAIRRARAAPDSLEGWQTATDAYAGSLLPGFYDDWVVAERDRLNDLHSEALRALTEGRLAARQHEAAVDAAHRLVRADPDAERPRQLLARVQAERPAGAMSLPASSARSKPPDALGNLPLRLTRFFGRAEELAALADLLGRPDVRLVTLTGPGGAGKTRLAIEAARRFDARSAPGGVWFVPLADCAAPAQLPGALRDALGLPRQAGDAPLEQVAEHLRDRPALVVLDNLEHLLGRGSADPAGAAVLVRALADRLPDVTWLVTSRRPLGIDGEAEFALPLLPTPPPGLTPADLLDYTATQLFVDRARQRRPDFAVTPRNVEALARLLVRLEGIPLAIELAAAWSKLLSPAQMLARLERRFELLVSPHAGAPDRHRTLRAAVEWGYELLSSETQRLFDALSVFRGTWTADAAEAVCGGTETLERLALLCDASLVRAEDGRTERRFSLLETLREFGDERLDSDRRAALETRHAEWCLERAEAAEKVSRGPGQKAAFDALEEDLPNLRAALARTVGSETGLRLVGALGYFWKVRSLYEEGLQWLTQALAAELPAPASVRAPAFLALGFLAEDRADFATARDAYMQARELYRRDGNDDGSRSATHNLGNVAYRQGDLALARELYSLCLAAYRRVGNPLGEASMLGSLANVAQDEGDLDEALQLQMACLARAREVGDARMVAYTLHNLGNLSVDRGKRDAALAYYSESLPAKEALGDRRGVASVRLSLGLLALEAGRDHDAEAAMREAVPTLRELGVQHLLAVAIEALAWLFQRRGDTALAARLWSAAASGRVRLGAPWTPTERENHGPLADAAAAARPADWETGARMSLDEAAHCGISHLPARERVL